MYCQERELREKKRQELVAKQAKLAEVRLSFTLRALCCCEVLICCLCVLAFQQARAARADPRFAQQPKRPAAVAAPVVRALPLP